jgi:flagellar hook-basal body complex protein FliE
MFAPSIVSSIVGAASAGLSSIASAAQNSPKGAIADVSFSEFLDQLTLGTVDTLKQGEAAAIGSIQGKIGVQQAVDAVMSAERTLQTAIAIRDKAVGAYQEITRMAI